MAQGLMGGGTKPWQASIEGAARGGLTMVAQGFGNQYSISNSWKSNQNPVWLI